VNRVLDSYHLELTPKSYDLARNLDYLLHFFQEHCRKYYKALETWIPWLSQAENKLDSLRPDSFSRRDVEKHLRDLSNFRNEVRDWFLGMALNVTYTK
jgi:hypothetical protein